MTNKRTGEQRPAEESLTDALAKYAEGEMTGEDWEERDRRIARNRLEEEKRARAQALRFRGKLLEERGAPQKHVRLITSGQVDKSLPVMEDVESWQRSGRRICVLAGPVGVGKTVAAVRWLANYGGVRPVFCRAGDFEARGRYSHVWRDAWSHATGMVLDDMGAEYKDAKGNLLADLDTLIDVYSVGAGRLVITTNLPWDSTDEETPTFQRRYEERIASRIVGSATWLNVAGPDRRRMR